MNSIFTAFILRGAPCTPAIFAAQQSIFNRRAISKMRVTSGVEQVVPAPRCGSTGHTARVRSREPSASATPWLPDDLCTRGCPSPSLGKPQEALASSCCTRLRQALALGHLASLVAESQDVPAMSARMDSHRVLHLDIGVITGVERKRDVRSQPRQKSVPAAGCPSVPSLSYDHAFVSARQEQHGRRKRSRRRA